LNEGDCQAIKLEIAMLRKISLVKEI